MSRVYDDYKNMLFHELTNIECTDINDCDTCIFFLKPCKMSVGERPTKCLVTVAQYIEQKNREDKNDRA